MATGGGEQEKAGPSSVDGDLYAVLGLKKECSAADLRNAYKKLALRWHPDRCSSSGSSKTVEEAKTKFQAIQGAYSVLSDTNKRFLYDVGVYEDDEGDTDGMGEFLGEMAAMMSQSKPNECGNQTFEELQELFAEMFQTDMDAFCGGGAATFTATATSSSRAHHSADGGRGPSTSSTCFPAATFPFCGGGGNGGHKRDSAEMCSGKAKAVAMSDDPAGLGPGGNFCFGVHDGDGSAAAAAARGRAGCGSSKRRQGRRHKASSRHGVSSQEGETQAQ